MPRVRRRIRAPRRAALGALALCLVGGCAQESGPSPWAPSGGEAVDHDPGPSPQVGPIACQPSCATATCGSDGCGSVCGVCPPDQLCSAGQCVAAGADSDVVVETAAATHVINREIYGGGFVSKSRFETIPLTVNRFGGNGTTRYNFRNNRSNACQDWYFLNDNDKGEGTQGTDGFYGYADLIVRDALEARAVPMVTLSTIGWVAKDAEGDAKQCGFPRSLFPVQQSFWQCGGADWCAPDCGNGKTPEGENIPGSALLPPLTSVPVDASFAAEHVRHLVSRFGSPYTDRLHFYQLDNEMTLWSYTHRDLHPSAVTYEEVWHKTLEYAPAIRAADPKGRILGYGTWGVMDVADTASDKKNHDNAYLLEWYLQQLSAHERATGERLVDCVDLHFYPLLDPSVEDNVLNGTRPLWDETFRITDWQQYIFGSQHIRLFPRVREWIREHYPGTGICLSEYNFNPDNRLSTLVQAEALGVFGREGLMAAAYWAVPDWDKAEKQWPSHAFRMYLDYDGRGGRFGENALSTAVARNGQSLSAFSARRSSDRAITVLLINKGRADLTPRVFLRGATAATAETWVYRVGDTAIAVGTPVAIAAQVASVPLPARSMKLLVVR